MGDAAPEDNFSRRSPARGAASTTSGFQIPPPDESRRVHRLGYGRAPGVGTDEPIHAGLQYLAGLLGYGAIAGGFVGAAVQLRTDAVGVFMAYFAAVAVVIIGGGVLRHRLGWRSFMPGVFTGIGLTCLVPPVAIWFTCFR